MSQPKQLLLIVAVGDTQISTEFGGVKHVAAVLSAEEVAKAVGLELRTLREQQDLSQHQIGEVLGFNRDAISKQELGARHISLYDYLLLMDFYRDTVPDHPGVALARRLLGRKPRK